MPNPLNPLDWLKSAQDWFSRTERSSGFRPYLVFFLLSLGAGLVLLSIFPNRPFVELLGLLLIGVPAACFVPLYAWKAHCDPDFCRSETHVQRLKRIELETMGSETRQIEGEVLEQQSLTASESEPSSLHAPDRPKGDE